MKFTKKGNYVLVESFSKSKSISKTLARKPNEYRITPLECPFDLGHGDPKPDQEPNVHWICTCPDFMMGRISRGINPLAHPCKHIVGFLLSEEVGFLEDVLYELNEGDVGGDL